MGDATALDDDSQGRAAIGARAAERRALIIRWLRKTHGWIGLWGAILGLLFGISGILLNHRAVMKFPAAEMRETSWQVKLPQPAPATGQAMADWLQHELLLDAPATRVREEPSRSVAWGDKALKQPPHWTMFFSSARSNLQAEYWVGNDYVGLRRTDANFLAMLNNLHKGIGGGAAWVLLADSIGGAMILLSLTGVILWTQLNRRRLIGTLILTVSIVLTCVLAVRAL
jgi:uncharacterized protein